MQMKERRIVMSKDLFDSQICVECDKPCHFGSGRFVNRIPAENDEYSGYQCPNCQSIECDGCNTKTLDYHICNETMKVYCDDCTHKKKSDER